MTEVSVGLILVRHVQSDKVYWQRIRICEWEATAEHGREDMWFAPEGVPGGPGVVAPKPAAYFTMGTAEMALALGIIVLQSEAEWVL